MSFRKIAVSGLKWTTIGTIGRSLFQILQISILTRFLPKEAFGLVAMALVVVQFSNIFIDMGFTSAILHKQDATEKEYSSIYWLNIIIALVLFLLLFLTAPLISNFYDEVELNTIVPLLGINLLLLALGRQHRTIMQKEFQFKAIAIIEMVSFCFALIVAIILAYKNFGVYSLVYSTLAASLLANALFLIINVRKNPVRLHFKVKDTKPFLKVGGFAMGSSVLDFFSREIDIIIIGKMLGAESLGLYSLAKQIVIKLYAVINPIIVNVLSPILSSLQKEKDKLKSYYLQSVNLLGTINFPFYLILIVLSREIITVLYGKNFVAGSVVMSFLAVSYAVISITNPVGSLQIATGRTDLGLKWTILRVSITPLIIYFAALYDINTVAAVIAVLNIALIVPLWRIQIKPMAHLSLKEYLDQFIKPLFLLLFISALFWLFQQVLKPQLTMFLSLSIKAVTAIVFYFGFLWLIDKKGTESKYLLIRSLALNKR